MDSSERRKAGIIRCQDTEHLCPGTTDLKVAANGKGAFEQTGPVEVIGLVSCGGCRGKRAPARAEMMVEKGAQVIALASCLKWGTPMDYQCPPFEQMRQAIEEAVEQTGTRILEYTH